jgi:hypothetical protein
MLHSSSKWERAHSTRQRHPVHTPHASPIPVQVFIGNQPAPVVYAGDSGYPGVQLVNATISNTVTPGCQVSVVAVSGTGSTQVSSNVTAIPVATEGGVCSDPALGIDGTLVTALGQAANPLLEDFIVNHDAVSGQDTVQATFERVVAPSDPPPPFTGNVQASVSSCSVTQTVAGSASSPSTVGQNAGTVTASGPGGVAALIASGTGVYQAPLQGSVGANGGTVTISGPGNANVPAFNASLTVPPGLANFIAQVSSLTINPSLGADFSWTGGLAGAIVVVTQTSTDPNTGVSGSYSCSAPAAAGSLHVPGSITQGMPSGSGEIDIFELILYTPERQLINQVVELLQKAVARDLQTFKPAFIQVGH